MSFFIPSFKGETERSLSMNKENEFKIVITNVAREANEMFYKRSHYVDGIKALARDAFNYFDNNYVEELVYQNPELQGQAEDICDGILRSIVNRVQDYDYEGAVDVIYATSVYHPLLKVYIEAFVCRSDDTIRIFAEEFVSLIYSFRDYTDFSCLENYEDGGANGYS